MSSRAGVIHFTSLFISLLVHVPFGSCKTEINYTLTRRFGSIMIPKNSVGNYSNDVILRWNISASSPMRYNLKATKFDIEPSFECKNDHLKVFPLYDGAPQSPHLPVLCGTMNGFNDSGVEWSVESYGVMVEFKTDESVTSSGFRLEYEALELESDVLCDKMRTGDAFEGAITANFWKDLYRYPANLNCTWNLGVLTGTELRISFLQFNLEYSGKSCTSDRFTVDTFQPDKHLGTFCGKRNRFTLTVAKAGLVKVNLITDQSDNNGKFYIDYFPKTLDTHKQVLQPQSVRIRGGESGTLSAPLSSFLIPGRNIVCSWHLRTDPGYRIRIKAQLSVTVLYGNVMAVFYDGPDETFIDRYQYNLKSGLMNRTSSGFHATLSVTLEHATHPNNLVIEYETFNFFLTSDILFRYLDIGDYTYLQHPKELFRCCVYHAIVAPHKKTIAFNLLDVGLFTDVPNSDGCSRAGVVVFDGGFDKSQTIGPVCDTVENRLYDMFNTFVSGSSTIYIFLYGYTNGPGRRSHPYELDPWPTTCSVQHINKEWFSQTLTNSSLTETPKFVIKRENAFNLNVHLKFDPTACFLLYIHSLQHSEPNITLTLHAKERLETEMCERWRTTQVVPSGESLPQAFSKFTKHRFCDNSFMDNETLVYTLPENKDAKWSRRLGRLAVGNVRSHLCQKVQICSQKFKYSTAPCGIIEHTGNTCIWVLSSKQENVPFYWSIDILILSSAGYPGRTCRLSVTEKINGGKTNMTTAFYCTDMNGGRLRHYRTMEENRFLTVWNTYTFIVKLRYTKTYFTPEEQSIFIPAEDEQFCTNTSLQFQNSCYEFYRAKGTLSWLDANSICKSKGGNLVSVLSSEELDFLKKALVLVWNGDFFQPPFGVLFIGLSNLNSDEVYRWEDGNPLSFTDWYHAWDLAHNIVPESPRLPLRYWDSQPATTKSTRCVAMAVGNAYYSTNWMKIPCKKTFDHPSYICKTTIRYNASLPNESFADLQFPGVVNETQKQDYLTTDDERKNWTQSENEEKFYRCPQNWTFISDHCYLLISEDIRVIDDTPKSKALPLCESFGGNLASIDKLPTKLLTYYLKLWGIHPGDGNIWVRTTTGDIGCTSMSTLKQQRAGTEKSMSNGCILNEGRAGFVLCDRALEIYTISCQPHHLRCLDGTCIHDAHVCDGHRDCLGGEDEIDCEFEDNNTVFRCKDNSIVSISLRCDHWEDCPDGSDEIDCKYQPCDEGEYRCSNHQCVPIEQKCDFIRHCLDGSDERRCNFGLDTCRGYECPSGVCLPWTRVNDLIPDCPDGSEADEKSAENFRLTFFTHENGNWRKKEDYSALCHGTVLSRRCYRDRMKCFNRANVCVYDHNEQGDLLYCRDGAHLDKCKYYQCPGMFKCPQSYCIPLNKVCDGVIDCPGGFEEERCSNYTCLGHLRCKGSNQCVSEGQLCDGRVHCKGSYSDEQFCDLRFWKCPTGCKCRGYAVDCAHANLRKVPENLLPNTRSLLLQQNLVTLENSSFSTLSYLFVLRLALNNITNIPLGTFSELKNLHILDLRKNNIQHIYAEVFQGLESLVELLFHGNPIQILPSRAFLGLISLDTLNMSRLEIQKVESGALVGLNHLKCLDLSYNKISTLESGFLSDDNHIDSLYLNGNNLENTSADVFREVTAETMWTDSYRFCCFVESAVDECHPSTGVFSSCEDLLSTNILRILVWFLGICCILGNTMVAIWRVYSGCHNRPAVYVANLSISDLLMGIYLIVLASTDIFYRGEYILHDMEWRRSGICQLLGILTTVSCEMSMFTLVALAWDRFLTVKFPFSVTLRKVKGSWIIMTVLWALSFLLALIPVAIPGYFKNFYGKNSICMPFNYTDPTSDGWEYATVVFVALNSVCLVVIITLYVILYCSVRESNLNVGRTDRSDLVVARRLSIVLITNIISWIPVIVANIISISVAPLTREMAAILTTVVLPLNPAINPYLYTFSSCLKRERKKPIPTPLPSSKTSQTHL